MKTTTPIRTLAASLALALLTAPALQAAVIVHYTFGSELGSPTTEADFITGEAATFTGLTNANFSSGSGTAFIRGDASPADFDSGKYLEFTVNADSGYFMNLENLEFSMGGTNSSGTLTYTVGTAVRSNEDTFGSDLTINPGAVTTASYTVATSTTTYTGFTVDLSGAEFDNRSSITFRFYPEDDSNNGSNFFRYASLTLNGTVEAVPEPGPAAMLALMAAGVLVLRRRSTQARSFLK